MELMKAVGAVVGAAMGLASAGLLLYRLGAWRSDMENTKKRLGSEVAQHRAESMKEFDALGRRFDSVDRFIAQSVSHQGEEREFRGRTDERLQRVEDEIENERKRYHTITAPSITRVEGKVDVVTQRVEDMRKAGGA